MAKNMYQKREERKNKPVEEKTTTTNINWYPGHMVKAQNEIKDSLKLIDIIVEVLDARIPYSSQNPLINELAKNKKRIIVLNKSDLADKQETKKWIKYFEEKGAICVENVATTPNSIKNLISIIRSEGEKLFKDREKNKNIKIEIKPIYRILILGIPNVGKSTIINKIAGKNSANVGNKPGVTKKKQWIRVSSNIDLLDTPGLLWPKLGSNDVGANLALTGNIKQEIIDIEELACIGIEKLVNDNYYKELLSKKYNLDKEEFDCASYDILEKIGRKRGCIVSGGNVDMTKAASVFLEDLKSGKIGLVTLDKVNNIENID